MSYSFYLDGTLYNNPADDKKISSRIRRNATLNGVVTTQEAKVSFQGDAYTYLYDIFFDGICTEVEVQIYDACDNASYLIYDGIIKISDIKIDYQRCAIETSIEDKDFFSYINNNKTVKVDLFNESLSKSGEVISALDEYSFKLFAPCTGVYDSSFVHKGVLVFDALNYMLQYITDGRVTLQSDLLSGNGSVASLILTQGLGIKSLNNGSPTTEGIKLGFKTLYDAVKAIYNVAFVMESDGTVMRIEKQDYFFNTTEVLNLEAVKDLGISVDNKAIYSSVLLGTDKDLDDITNPGSCSTTPAGIVTTISDELFGWGDAQFHLFGQCNEDNELNLQYKFYTASDLIEDIYIGASLEFDDDLILIEVEQINSVALTCRAISYSYTGAVVGTTVYYNLGLNNQSCLSRRYDSTHNNIQSYLQGLNQGRFRATGPQTSYSTQTPGITSTFINDPPVDNIIQPVVFNNDTTGANFDTGGNYNTGTYQYTCPSDGDYTFTHSQQYTTQGSYLNNFLTVFVSIVNTTTGGVVQQSVVISSSSGGVLLASGKLICFAGDIIVASISLRFQWAGFQNNFGITFKSGTNNDRTGSYFSCAASPTSEGVVQDVSSEEFKALLFKFEYPITGEEYRQITDDPTQLVTITSNEQKFRGWIDDLKYNHWEGKAQITLRSNAINQDT